MKQLYKIICAVGLTLSIFHAPTATAQCTCADGKKPDSIVHLQTLSSTANFDNEIKFPKFPPGTGTLTCVSLSGVVTTIANLGIKNLDSSDRTYRFRYTQDIMLEGPGGLFASAYTDRIYGPVTLTKYNTPADSTSWGPDTTFKIKEISNLTSNTASFLGKTGTVSVFFSNTGSTTLLQGSNNYRATVQTYALGDFKLVYFWCPNTVLSSRISSFSAIRANGRKISLQWTAENEYSANQYQIEYSRNGRDFTVLDTRKAMSSGTARYDYVFEAPEGENGRFYFRVRQTDLQGRVNVSPVRSIAFGENGSIRAGIYPNPARNMVTISFDEAQSGELDVDLLNTQGQVLENNRYVLSKAGNVTVRFASTPSAGVYWLRIRNRQSGEQSVSRIVIAL